MARAGQPPPQRRYDHAVASRSPRRRDTTSSRNSLPAEEGWSTPDGPLIGGSFMPDVLGQLDHHGCDSGTYRRHLRIGVLTVAGWESPMTSGHFSMLHVSLSRGRNEDEEDSRAPRAQFFGQGALGVRRQRIDKDLWQPSALAVLSNMPTSSEVNPEASHTRFGQAAPPERAAGHWAPASAMAGAKQAEKTLSLQASMMLTAGTVGGSPWPANRATRIYSTVTLVADNAAKHTLNLS